jgi:hypothetical protein
MNKAQSSRACGLAFTLAMFLCHAPVVMADD